MCRRPVRQIELLRAREHKWQNIIIKPGHNPLRGITGELFEIKAEIDLADAEQVGFHIRGVPVVYDVHDREIRCLGRHGPLKPVNNRIRLHLLVDRTSVEIFGNDGLFSMSNCMLPQDRNKTLELFCKRRPRKAVEPRTLAAKVSLEQVVYQQKDFLSQPGIS